MARSSNEQEGAGPPDHTRLYLALLDCPVVGVVKVFQVIHMVRLVGRDKSGLVVRMISLDDMHSEIAIKLEERKVDMSRLCCNYT